MITKITNEEIFESILSLKTDIQDIYGCIAATNKELVNTKRELVESISDTDKRLSNSILDLRQSTVDGFDRVFQVIDDIRNESKQDIFEFRKDVNQRFTAIENRLSNIEDNMVYRHELSKQFV